MGKVYRIHCLEYIAETGLIRNGAKVPSDLFKFASEEDGDPDIILEYNGEIEEEKQKAFDWLKSKRNTCERVQVFHGVVYQIKAYSIEMITESDDGDYLDREILDVALDENSGKE